MLAKPELVEQRDRISGKDLLRRVARIKRQKDRDQPAHDMGIAVAEILQYGLVAALAIDPLRKPHLARAALHLVFLGMLGFGHRLEHAAEFADVPIAGVPILQQHKVLSDFVDRHDGPCLDPEPQHRIPGGRKRYGTLKMPAVPGLNCRHGAGGTCHSALRSSTVSVSRGAMAASDATSSLPPIELVWSGGFLSVMI